MTSYQYITLREKPEWMKPAAEWFHNKWGVPTEAYLECMEAYLRGEISPVYLVTDHTGFYERYGWEFLCMVQGDDEPEMTRMYVHR